MDEPLEAVPSLKATLCILFWFDPPSWTPKFLDLKFIIMILDIEL